MTSPSSFLATAEIADLGLAAVGAHARISRFARFYGIDRIWLGDDVRIDDFAVLSAAGAGIRLLGFNHIGVAGLVFGEVTFREWSTLSSRAAVYGMSDDFTVDAHTYPHVEAGRAVVTAPVVIGSRVVIGTGSTILPGVTIHANVSVGAMSLVRESLVRPGLYAGVPTRYLRERRSGQPATPVSE